jgi:glyoxylase-like metal-dependent hydrolase (beta-lactamase superfamily II)
MPMNEVYIFERFRKENEATTYLVACASSLEAMIVDPGDKVEELERVLADRGMKLRYVALTHSHPTHAQGIAKLIEGKEARVVAHPEEMPQGTAGREIRGGDRIILGKLRVEAVETPGESPGGTSYLLPFGPGEMGSVLTGDALSAGRIGGIGGQGDPMLAVDSVRKALMTLGDGVRVYPGHGPATTIGVERHHNPYL